MLGREARMAELATVELNSLLDDQKLRAPAIVFVVVAILALVSDGYDLSVMGYVAPELVKSWHVAQADLVPVFSAGIIGLLVGAPLLGFFGDRFGRKKAILLGLCIIGALTLASALARSLPQLIVLRFLTGIGLGGLNANIIALAAEIAPRRMRGAVLVLVSFGMPAGFALSGLAAAGLLQPFGWPSLFLVGGVPPLMIAAAGAFLLPESIRFLAGRGGREEEVRRIAHTIRPELAIGPSTRFVVAEPQVASGSFRGLFAGGLGAVTPLLWVAFAANQMANFFVLTWLPTLLQSLGASSAQAGVSSSLFSFGGLAGGAVLLLLMDRLGVVPMMVLFLAGAPLVAAIGLPDLSAAQHALVIAGAGFCITGINFSMNAAVGMIYPTPVRSVGVGWANAAGRAGAFAAPALGGTLLAWHVSTQELLLAPAVVLGIGALCCGVLAVLCIRRYGGTRLGEAAAPPAVLPRQGDFSGPVDATAAPANRLAPR
jgi:AAHS family 4-hydroxybenzoate transporter-like MFS transporter